VLQRLCQVLPNRVAHTIGAGLGLVWFNLLRYRRSLVQENLGLAFARDPHDREIRRLARANFVHYGLLTVEILRLRSTAQRGLPDVRFVGLEHLEQARNLGRGVLVLTAHLGNYDLLAVAVASTGLPVSIVSKELRSKQIERFWMSERESCGVRIFTRHDSPRQLLNVLRENEILGIVLDQHAHDGGVLVDFFGRPASTLRTLAVLAERSQAPVVPIFTRRCEDGSHIIEVHQPVPFEPQEGRQSSVIFNTQRYTSIIEYEVRRCPEQWTWIHRRWKPPRKNSLDSDCGERTAVSANKDWILTER
jgi:KDO2-lipid IV(A) lauroyltransferase